MLYVSLSSRDSLKANFKTRKCKDSDNEMAGWRDGDGGMCLFVFVILMIRGVIDRVEHCNDPSEIMMLLRQLTYAIKNQRL